jgi:hypothetical protein
MKKHPKKKSSKKKTPKLKYIIYFLLLVIFSLLAFITGILYTQKTYEKELHKSKNSIKILQQKIKELKKQPVPVPAQEKAKTTSSEIIDYKKAHNTAFIIPPKTNTKPKTRTSSKKKPKLVIIIDDVSFNIDIKRIKAIPYHITPSFFPPTKRHPNTAFYATEFSHYMIHLPLEAAHFNKPEPDTLNVNDPYYTVLNRIIQVKKLFPKAHFLNNHTGSTYTADTNAMKKLFEALKAENMGFVDSKTTPNSKAAQADKSFHIPLYARNIFLDNIEKTAYIRNQLKKAVLIAKKRGYAIAIGHPHAVTLETLKNAKDILKDVKVVYIDELNKRIKN